ncbi:hypothetical protein AGR1B_Lc10035 [Agrobacterium fabacearum S56]|nr:hypothetical protein AGR1B_Lc10035 [Agrobacterium fabacearum S56]
MFQARAVWQVINTDMYGIKNDRMQRSMQKEFKTND